MDNCLTPRFLLSQMLAPKRPVIRTAASKHSASRASIQKSKNGNLAPGISAMKVRQKSKQQVLRGVIPTETGQQRIS